MQVRRLAEQMDRDDRFGSRRYRGDGRVGIDVEGIGVDVHEDRLGAEPDNRAGRGEERVRARYDLVAGPDAEGHQRRQQRVSTRRHRDGVFDAKLAGQVLFEGFDFGAADEALTVDDASDGREQRVAERGVLRL